jgi:hypothetical protein
MYDDDGGEHHIPLAHTSGPIDLEVSNSSGEITVRAGDGPVAVVRFEKVGGRGNDSQLHIEVNDSRIKIEPRSEGGLSGLLKRNHGSFDIDVELPRERLADRSARVRVRTASGEVAIDDVPGDVQVNTASGDAHVTNTDGQVTVQSASGDVSITRPRGQVTARTASGDIHIEHGVLSRFAISTASGDTHLTGELTGNAASKVESVSGDVWLQIAAPAICELRYATVSGDASIEGALQKVASRTWRMGEGGGPSISVKTVSGDLHIEGRHAAGETEPIGEVYRAADTLPLDTPPTPPTPPAPPTPAVPPTPPTPPTPPVQAAQLADTGAAPASDTPAAEATADDGASSSLDDAERLEVLQALERGEIDIDEALNRLGVPDEPDEAYP